MISSNSQDGRLYTKRDMFYGLWILTVLGSGQYNMGRTFIRDRRIKSLASTEHSLYEKEKEKIKF